MTGLRSDPVSEGPEGPPEVIDKSASKSGSGQAPGLPAAEARSPQSVPDAQMEPSIATATPLVEATNSNATSTSSREGVDPQVVEVASPESIPDVRHETPIATAAPPENPQPSGNRDKSASAWYVGFKATLDLVVQVSDVFPPLKSAAVAVQTLVGVYDVSSNIVWVTQLLISLLAILRKPRRI